MTAGDRVLDRLTLQAMVPPGDECRRIRNAAKATRRDVAEAMGVTQQTVIRWEMGVGPGPQHREAYVRLLGELRRVAELRGSWDEQ
jgi:transcriptional regulator with XRE-family HTH domain